MNQGTLEILDDKNQVIMTIHEEMNGPYMAIAISGKITNEVLLDFKDELIAIACVCQKIKVDLSKTDYICSDVLSSLLSVQRMIEKKDDPELVIVISSEIKQVFEDSGYIEILHVEVVS